MAELFPVLNAAVYHLRDNNYHEGGGRDELREPAMLHLAPDPSVRFQMGGGTFRCKECLDSHEQLAGLGRQRPVTDKAAVRRTKQGV